MPVRAKAAGTGKQGIRVGAASKISARVDEMSALGGGSSGGRSGGRMVGMGGRSAIGGVTAPIDDKSDVGMAPMSGGIVYEI